MSVVGDELVGPEVLHTVDRAAGSGYGNERCIDRRARQLSPVCVEFTEIVSIEGSILEPLDRAEREDALRDRRPVADHEVDLGVVGARPVAADDARHAILAGEYGRRQTLQGFADDRLDRSPTPRGP